MSDKLLSEKETQPNMLKSVLQSPQNALSEPQSSRLNIEDPGQATDMLSNSQHQDSAVITGSPVPGHKQDKV